MKIRFNGVEITKWENMTTSIIYDAIKSTFSFDWYWNPFEKSLRNVMLPGGFITCTLVSDNDELLLTGVLINPSFRSSSTPSLVNVSGYSLTGVLDDVEYGAVFATTMTNNLTFLQICQNVCDAFGLGLVDNSDGAATLVTLAIADVIKPDDTIGDYLAQIARDNNITLSHDAYGNLVLNVYKETKPIADFGSGMLGVEYFLTVDGSQLHSTITAKEEASGTNGFTVTNVYCAPQGGFNYRTAAINNGNILNKPLGQLQVMSEYNTGYRPRLVIKSQSDQDSTSLEQVAKQALADELKAIDFTIVIPRWELNKKIVLPGNSVTVTNPELFCFNKVKLFIRQVDFTGDSEKSTAVMHCCIPECFNGEVPKFSIFYGTNYTNFVQERIIIGGTEPFITDQL